MSRGILNELLPVLPKTNFVHPIKLKTKEEIQQELNIQAELERLATKSVNQDPNILYFEPVQHSLFKLFPEQDETIIDFENNGLLKLLPVGDLSLRNFKETNSTAIFTLNTKQYEEQRKMNQMQIVLSSHDNNLIDEEYFPNTQDVNNMLESLLGDGNTIESTTEDPMMIDRNEDVQNTDKQPVETNIQPTSGLIVEPNNQHVETNTREQINISSSDSEVEVDTTMVEVEPLEPREPAVVPGRYIPTLIPAETPDIIPSNVSEGSVSSPPTIITATAPKRNVEPTPLTSLSDKWYNDDMITLDTTQTKTSKIYSYKPQIIPIFPTKEQQKLCDKVMESNKLTKNNAMFNVNIEKMVNILNFPSSNLDILLQDQWKQSGKTMFIKRLLEGLLGTDLILLIVARDLNEEEALVELVGNSLKLDCVRINYCLDDTWNGEYGILIKTKTTVNQQKGTAERGSSFTSVADFIICMDIRISKDNALFEKISKRGTLDKNVPSAWLISLGSVEERTFHYLNQHNIVYSAKKSDDLKEVMTQNNDWPLDTSNVEELNCIVADNVKLWLAQIEKNNQYQYRSTKELPKSYLLGHLKPIPEVVEENTSDMDIASDTEYTQSPPIESNPPSLSEAAISFVDKVIVPLFNINKGELIETESNEIFIELPDGEKEIIKSLQDNVSSDYRNEVTNLKRQYETAFQELQQRFRNEIISKLEVAKRKIE